MEEAATFAVCRMIRHDVSHQRSYKPSIGLPRSARAGQANARDQVSLRVEGQFPQRPTTSKRPVSASSERMASDT